MQWHSWLFFCVWASHFHCTYISLLSTYSHPGWTLSHTAYQKSLFPIASLSLTFKGCVRVFQPPRYWYFAHSCGGLFWASQDVYQHSWPVGSSSILGPVEKGHTHWIHPLGGRITAGLGSSGSYPWLRLTQRQTPSNHSNPPTPLGICLGRDLLGKQVSI
jgi:hypothetical protein